MGTQPAASAQDEPGDRGGEPPPAPAMNLAVVIGELVTETERRTLPGGTDVLGFSLTVRRAGKATTSVPCLWYDPPARALRWTPGHRLVVVGAVVRRFFQAGGATASRTEVQVQDAQCTSAKKRSATMIADAEHSLAEIALRLVA